MTCSFFLHANHPFSIIFPSLQWSHKRPDKWWKTHCMNQTSWCTQLSISSTHSSAHVTLRLLCLHNFMCHYEHWAPRGLSIIQILRYLSAKSKTTGLSVPILGISPNSFVDNIPNSKSVPSQCSQVVVGSWNREREKGQWDLDSSGNLVWLQNETEGELKQ